MLYTLFTVCLTSVKFPQVYKDDGSVHIVRMFGVSDSLEEHGTVQKSYGIRSGYFKTAGGEFSCYKNGHTLCLLP